MKSLKTAEQLVQAAQIGGLIEATLTAAEGSRDEDRKTAAAWWKEKLEGLLRRVRQQQER